MITKPIVGLLVLLFPAVGASADEKKVILTVDHMTCAVCPVTVTKAIERVEGVLQVSVDYDTARAIVRYEDASTTWQEIAEASTNAGYPASRDE